MKLAPDGLSLAGRVALVTGAAAGIGRATALALARFGADCAVCDRDEAGLATVAGEIEGLGRRCWQATIDVREADAVRAFVDEVAEAAGRIDVLVNNAGGTFQATFEGLSPGGEQALVAENWSTVSHCVRAALPHLPDGASIVNVTSVEAHRAGPGYAVYSAMKAAVASFAKSLALELGGRGIRVNCVAPDVIPTPGIGDPDANTPLARKGHVDDVAAAVLYLASDWSGFVTGTTLHVDGGTHAAGGWRRREDGGFEL